MEDESKRPWGEYEVLLDDSDHKVKRITVLPGKRLSLQSHQKRSEHWYVVRGSGTVQLDDKQILLQAGDAIDIPCGCKHRIGNYGQENLVFIEVQTGSYFGEDDIQRFEDDFGRS